MRGDRYLDIGVAWFMSGYVMQCSTLYTVTGECGTYLEIHQPNNETILQELRITSNYANGFKTEFISRKNLCVGKYEFWMVLRTRNGRILQHVKPFYSAYPSCSGLSNLDNTNSDDESEDDNPDPDLEDPDTPPDGSEIDEDAPWWEKVKDSIDDDDKKP
mmetsp:Transcript_40128/g.38635  ORF Transcript_40128/g.38635 Transcript_40128/m.38635 type:complete len:160 (+) Transcript_40128:36-515(+)